MKPWPSHFERMDMVDQLVKEHGLRGTCAAILHRVAARCATENGCTEGQAGIAKGLGMSRQTVNKAFKDLVELNILRKEKRFRQPSTVTVNVNEPDIDSQSEEESMSISDKVNVNYVDTKEKERERNNNGTSLYAETSMAVSSRDELCDCSDDEGKPPSPVFPGEAYCLSCLVDEMWDANAAYPGLMSTWRKGPAVAKTWYRQNPEDFRQQLREYEQKGG